MQWVFIHITKIACLGFGHRPFPLHRSNLRHFLAESFKFQRNKNKIRADFPKHWLFFQNPKLVQEDKYGEAGAGPAVRKARVCK